MLPSPRPTRRWLQFSLRTLFVLVAVLALFLGWLNWARRWDVERRKMEDHPGLRGAYRESIYPHKNSPWLLKPVEFILWDDLAASSFDELVFSDETPAETLENARRLFPEAEVLRESEFQKKPPHVRPKQGKMAR